MSLHWIYVIGNNKIYLGFHVKCLDQICIFSTDFHNSPQHQIPQTSVQWQPHWYKRKDASHKSNPSSVPQGYVQIHTLGHVGDSNRCVGGGGDTL